MPASKIGHLARRSGVVPAAILGVGFALTAALPAAGQPATGEVATTALPLVVPRVFAGDLRQLPKAAAPVRPHTWKEPEEPPLHLPRAAVSAPPSNLVLGQMPLPDHGFNGLAYDSGTGPDPVIPVKGGQAGAGWPPDVNGDVGPAHYVEAVNDAYAVFNKTGGLLTAFTQNSLWSSAAAPCNGDSRGDAVVLYDALADRWILTHFAFATDGGGAPVAPFVQCIAVSQTGDPVAGGWWLYAIRMDTGGTGQPPVGTLNDYPKFGLWTDCLYMAANGYSEPAGSLAGVMVASFSRADLYAGRPLTGSLGFVASTADPFTMIPSTLLGTGAGSLPPPGTPNYFVSQSWNGFSFEVRKFTAGPNCGSGGTLSPPVNVSQATYSQALGLLVPQPGTPNLLDSVGHKLMQKVPYRRIGNRESLWVTHTVRSGSTLAPQWAQLDVTGGTIAAAPVQQQIYMPDAVLYRWVPSLAVDAQGNLALGYSASNSSTLPSIGVAGRLAGDPLNNLPQAERVLVSGDAAQTYNTSRWGDYTSMSIDPSDDCTFWYVNEYYGNDYLGSIGTWYTFMSAFKYSGCVPTVAPDVVTTPASGISSGGATLNGTVNPNGVSASASFVWGTSASYGNTTASQSAGSGSAAVHVSVNLTGLACATSYHFQAVAANGGTTAYGGDQTFTTGACSGPPPPLPMSFYTIPPCRLLDTRPNPLAGNTTYEIAVANHCGIPATAKAVSANITAVGASSGGFLTFWPAQTSPPNTSTLNFAAGAVRANNSILLLAPGSGGSPGAIAVEFGGAGEVNVILDVNGYFQ